MKIKEFLELPIGLYRLFWKSGGWSTDAGTERARRDGAEGDAMTDEQKLKAIALGKCVMHPGTSQKRFAQSMKLLAETNGEISEKQSAYLDLMIHRYRRQIPKTHKRFCNCPEAQEARAQMELSKT